MKKVFVFGTNALSEVLAYYLDYYHLPFDGFVLNREFVNTDEYRGVYLSSIEEQLEKFGNDSISVYIAIGYANMNQSRKTVYNWLKDKRIEILSFLHPDSLIAGNVIKGEGNIVLENSCIQPFVKLGDCNIVWNNTSICHHSDIGSFNYISPSSTITGRVEIGDNCFLGANCTIKNDVCIDNFVLIGAGAYVYHNLSDGSVFVPSRGQVLQNAKSSSFKLA